MSAAIFLQAGRERSVLRRHPWIFSKAIDKVKGKPNAGEPVDLFTHDGRWLARARNNFV